MCPAFWGSTVSYAGVAHFPKHSLEYSLSFWNQPPPKKNSGRESAYGPLLPPPPPVGHQLMRAAPWQLIHLAWVTQNVPMLPVKYRENFTITNLLTYASHKGAAHDHHLRPEGKQGAAIRPLHHASTSTFPRENGFGW